MFDAILDLDFACSGLMNGSDDPCWTELMCGSVEGIVSHDTDIEMVPKPKPIRKKVARTPEEEAQYIETNRMNAQKSRDKKLENDTLRDNESHDLRLEIEVLEAFKMRYLSQNVDGAANSVVFNDFIRKSGL